MTTTNKFKETEIGKIPVEWEVMRIDEVGEVVTGNTPSTKDEENWNGNIPFITPGDLTGYKVRNTERTITDKGLIESKKLPKNSVNVSCIGYIGKIAMTEHDISMTNQQINSVIPNNEKVDNHFLLFLLGKMEDRLNASASITTVPILNKTNFSGIKILIPPLPEQKAIAQKLTVIRNAIEQTQAVIEATEDLKKSMMKHLFTYGPVPAHQTDQVELKETEIGLVPEGWSIEKLGNVASFKNGINFKKEQKGDKGVLAIDVLNMFGEGVEPTLEGLYRVDKAMKDDYYLEDGDLLFVRSSLKREGVGWTNVFYKKELKEKITYVGFIIRARLNSDNIDSKFLAYYFRSDIGRKNLIESSGKVAITNINQGMLGDNDIPIPNIDVQNKIVTILSEIDSKILQENQKKEALESLFNSTLESLMSAKIRVN